MTDANLGRALLDWVLFEVADEILDVVRDQPGLRRPPADDAAGMAEFDDTLRAILKEGIHRRVLSND